MTPRLCSAVLVALLALACSNGGDDGAAPTSTEATTTSSSTSSTTTTTAPDQAVPLPDTAGEDFDRIFREMLAFEKYVFEHPAIDLLDVIYTADANIRPDLEAFVGNLVEKGWRYDDDGPEVIEVEVGQRIDPLNVLLNVVTRHGSQRVVDGDGNVVEEGEGWEPRREQYLLKQGDDGRWRIQHYENNGPVT